MFHPTSGYVSCKQICGPQRAEQFCSDNCPGYALVHRGIRPTANSHFVTNDYNSNIQEHNPTSSNGLIPGPTDIRQTSTADAVEGWTTTDFEVSVNRSLSTPVLLIFALPCVVAVILLTALCIVFGLIHRRKFIKTNDAHPAGPAHENEHINPQGQATADVENPEEADPMLSSPSTDLEQLDAAVIEPGQPKIQQEKLENNVDGQLCNETNGQYRSDHNQQLQSHRQPLTYDRHPGEPKPPMPDGSGQFDLHSSVDTRGHQVVDSVRHSDLEMIGLTPRPSQHPTFQTNSLNHSSCGDDEENYSANMQFVISNV
jgi:hypothetical protein